MPSAFVCSVLLVVTAHLKASAAGNAGCWTEGFGYEDCCGERYGPEGNSECWDEVYTYSVCCSGGPQAGQAAGGFTSGTSQSELGCDGPYFARFRDVARHYYSTGRLRPELTTEHQKVLVNFDSRFKLCAPAALQALLLRLEENIALEPAAASVERLAQMALRMQEGIQQELLTPQDMKAWPLAAGLEKVRQANALKAVQSTGSHSLTSGRVPKWLPGAGSVTLVVSYCREVLQWMNVTLRRRTIRRVDLAIVRKCEGADALRAMPVPLRRLWRSVDIVDVEDLPLRADECSAYLGYLEQRYDELPTQMVFVHADAPEHIGLETPNILDDTLRAALEGTKIPFAHLGMNRVTMRWDPITMTPLWRGIFGSSIAPGPSEVRTYCCSHFIVSRERVWRRPRRFYANALGFLTTTDSYKYLPTRRHALGTDIKGRLACQNMMFVWHVMFGEDLDLPHRMFDPNLPMFLKSRNIRMAYMNLQ